MDRPSSRIVCGDCVDVMRGLPAGSVDAICTDPPYLLNFMGKAFDSQDGAYSDPERMEAWHREWAVEAFRVLKPGGHLLAFGGTRTYHRLAAGVEDAGFEIRDTIGWVFGSGFPKSLDVSKAIDKAAGVEREVVGSVRKLDSYGPANDVYGGGPDHEREMAITEPATPEAQQWSGWGTALKPAWESIVVARKPLIGTVAANVLSHGTGALNIDACRIGWGAEGDQSAERKAKGYSEAAKKALGGVVAEGSPTGFSGEVEGSDASAGRWPANVVLGHSAGCVKVGARRVRTSMAVRGGTPEGKGIFNEGFPRGDGRAVGYGDGDGMEVVEAWECEPGCPVRLLDEQAPAAGGRGPASGPTFSGPSSSGSMAGDFKGMGERPAAFHGDAGGASRFFFCPDGGQVAEERPVMVRTDTTVGANSTENPTTGATSSGEVTRQGRWPANVVLDEAAAGMLDEQTGELGKSAGTQTPGNGAYGTGVAYGDGAGFAEKGVVGFGDSGGASRFLYCAKTSSAERSAGLDAFDGKFAPTMGNGIGGKEHDPESATPKRNVHPTVKPIELMRWLVRLVTPPGGTVLDPFMGSGTTGCAAALERFAFVGIEQEAEYVAIAEARIAWWAEHPDGVALVKRLERERERAAVAESGQESLF